MANRNSDGSRFVLNSWYILPQTKNELNILIRFLENNLKINIEINCFTPEISASDRNKIAAENLIELNASTYIISGGIDRSRVTCDHLAESKLPMFRFVKEG